MVASGNRSGPGTRILRIDAMHKAPLHACLAVATVALCACSLASATMPMAALSPHAFECKPQGCENATVPAKQGAKVAPLQCVQASGAKVESCWAHDRGDGLVCCNDRRAAPAAEARRKLFSVHISKCGPSSAPRPA